MTLHCSSPCIGVRNTLFQPARALNLARYSDEHAHFVILDFGGDRALWLGSRDKPMQIALYQALLVALGQEATESDRGSPIQ